MRACTALTAYVGATPVPCTVILLSPLQSIPVPAAKALAAETTMSVMAIRQAMNNLEICLLILLPPLFLSERSFISYREHTPASLRFPQRK